MLTCWHVGALARLAVLAHDALAHWGGRHVGALTRWHVDALARWCVGTSARRRVGNWRGTLASWCADSLVRRHIGIPFSNTQDPESSIGASGLQTGTSMIEQKPASHSLKADAGNSASQHRYRAMASRKICGLEESLVARCSVANLGRYARHWNGELEDLPRVFMTGL